MKSNIFIDLPLSYYQNNVNLTFYPNSSYGNFFCPSTQNFSNNVLLNALQQSYKGTNKRETSENSMTNVDTAASFNNREADLSAINNSVDKYFSF